MLGSIFWGSGFSPQVASAACTAAGSGGYSSAASISGNQVAICAKVSQAKATTSTTGSTGTPKALPNACVTIATTTAQIVAATLAGCKIAGPSLPPTSVAKPKPSPTVTKKTTTNLSLNSQSDQALLSPQPLSVQSSSSQVKVAEAVIFTSDAQEHERSAAILGRTGYVRFVPMGFEWSVAPGQDSAVAVHSFASVGLQKIELRVTYLASSRFALSETWMPVGEVTVSAATQVLVTEAIVQPAVEALSRVKPRLVYASCQKMPSKYRC